MKKGIGKYPRPGLTILSTDHYADGGRSTLSSPIMNTKNAPRHAGMLPDMNASVLVWEQTMVLSKMVVAGSWHPILLPLSGMQANSHVDCSHAPNELLIENPV
ncbi:hypothetical protein MUK70_19190 [Dyadobacter chenwenxiniae]|uniref:Uncharacterized protein n=1 Tax=Dyadobacter chenwenxiniae TaxID=2906456 RepID=A0A9X1PHJ9_9BACT|nr:hypothetical protein [Dyadobacter chenwenxiniae]MCF0061367.1 hypothetical protein [Dyadobacter chenwenxiniae]UON81189.1 hypothetical protein MUK70_19190 [Dyadobacter chenwenxiniae]